MKEPTEIYAVDFYQFMYGWDGSGPKQIRCYESKIYHSARNAKAAITYQKRFNRWFAEAEVRRAYVSNFEKVEL